MADNATANPGSGGATFATDQNPADSVHHWLSKVEWGAVDTFNVVDVAAGKALPIQLRNTSGTEIATAAAPVRIDPTGTTTQPVSDGGGNLSVDDGGSSLTVDGTVAVSSVGGSVTVVVSGPVDTELPAAGSLADNTANPSTSLVGACLMGFDGATWDRIYTVADGDVVAAATKGLIILGTDGSNYQVLATNASGHVLTSQQGTATVTVSGAIDTELPAAAALADAAANPTTPTIGGATLLFNGATWDRARGDTTNGLDVDVTRVSGTVTVDSELTTADLDTGAGTDTRAVVGIAGAASGGAVLIQATSGGALKADITTIAGTAPTTVGKLDVKGADGDVFVRQATAGNLNAQCVGEIAHDGVDSGNPQKIGAKALASPKGMTTVADGDRTNLFADLDGQQLVKLGTAYADIINERVADTGGTSTAFSNFSAVASTRNYVTTIIVFNSSATAGFLDLRDGTAGAVLMTIPLPAGGGAVINLPVPLRQPTTNTALAYDVSAALTTVYISLVGFQSKL